MVVITEYDSEKSRIEGTILAAINTPLEPAVAARNALGGAFPAAGFEDKEDGTLSVQGLDAAQRQSLEDALFELNLSLASQAVTKGLPLMQYLHPDATHDGITTVPRASFVNPPFHFHVVISRFFTFGDRFLQVCLELARPLLTEPIKDAEKAGGRRRLLDYEGWARLFEGLMEVGTIADCADLFRLMEGGGGAMATAAKRGDNGVERPESGSNLELGWSAVFCSEDFRREQGAKLALLRMSNMLFRRLSKAYDVRLCGRLLIFISRCYELNDKSGLNVAGALNTGLSLPVDEVEPGAVDSIGEQIDRRLYACFWGLQAIFQVLQPVVYGKVMADMSLVLDEFAAIKTPVAATGPWVAARHSHHNGQHRGAGDGTDAMEVEEGGGPATGGDEGGGGVGTRYLTSSKLFGLQVRDCTFRRHFLLQCLALLQYIEQPSKADKSAIGQRPEGLEAMRTKASERTCGKLSMRTLGWRRCQHHSVLKHEAHWVAWKHGTQPPASQGPAAAAAASPSAPPAAAATVAAVSAAATELCRDFTRPSAPPTREITSTSHRDTASGAQAPKRKRGTSGGRAGGGAAAATGGGRFAVSRGVMGLADPLAGLKVSERRTRARNLVGEEEIVPMLPTPPELLSPILEDLDPDNDVESQYRRVREAVFAWKRMRTLARNYLEFFKKGDDLEESVLEMNPDLKTKIAARKAEREAELAAAAAAEATEAGEVLPDAATDGAANDPNKPEEGEALASPPTK
ncbi:hypothetical protein VOLCADRAFT_104130 [Volvox carteri f. nagariensis]|uniref:Uncharacterized protein n=1 Tax=Volvox carteri f. nagariensis TaxID=3068 RepID=D8TRE8_VOLCA|nr:uncharacterized protein VOLCADRAFT_104130 [Volvox carteri f. nagariensis]EFJ49979.1 hypothetical protein VOLCADRAFT_104130 [Volvox carteri f. nagariensis]|eukprot:XP_002949044.1 hypothetical protein VOLCADRAFT_104130 [Volvox carteri f. nagariensis]